MPENTKPDKKSAPRRARKLPDFGQKIGGARKDIWSGQLRLADWESFTDEDWAKIARKQRIWPSAEFTQLLQKVRDRRAALRLTIIRQAIRPQAQVLAGLSFRESCRLYLETLLYIKAWATRFQRRQNWQEAVELLLDGICFVPKNPHSLEKWQCTEEDSKLCEAPRIEGVRDCEELLTLVLGKKVLFRLKSKFSKGSAFRTYRSRPIEQILAELRARIGIYDILRFKHVIYNVLIRRLQPTDEIWLKSPVCYRFIQKIKNALDYLVETETIKIKLWLKSKIFGKISSRPPPRPKMVSPRRSGLPPRYSRRPSPEKIMADLGIRGGEFGNWVTGRERPQVMARVYTALHDLAEVLEIEPSMIGLGGLLSVGFGSRGRGGRKAALAHFEPWSWCIALTRKKSNGSLCHEWAHAFDLWLGAHSLPKNIPPAFVRNAMLSKRIFDKVKKMYSRRPWPKDLYDPAHWAEFNLPFEVIRPLVFYAEHLYARPLKPEEVEALRASEEKSFHARVEMIGKMVADVLSHPFPFGKIRPYSPIKDHQKEELLRAAKEIAQVSPDCIQAIARMAAIIKQVSGHLPCKRFLKYLVAGVQLVRLLRWVETNVRTGRGILRQRNSWLTLLEQTGKYYSGPEEIFARSLETYVFLSLEKKGAQNQFLVSDYCKHPIYPDFSYNPEFEQAIGDLFRAIKTTGLLRKENQHRPLLLKNTSVEPQT